MRRPRPIRRLVDGTPDASGRAIARRAVLLVAPAMIGANFAGAAVVFSLAAWVVPTPDLDESSTTIILWNLVAGGIYVTAACVVGTLWGLRRFRPARTWLEAERPPTEREQRRALRSPLRQLVVNATLWLLAAVAFTALNATWSLELAGRVFVTVLLGGVTTCTAAYLLSERIFRPVAARALAHGAPERPVLPGVTTRALLAWMLGTAVPVLGLALICIEALAEGGISARELALTALALGAVAVAAGLIVAWQSARSISDPLRSLRDAVRRVERGDLEAGVPVFDGSELGLLQAGFNRMGAGLREREVMRDLFGRHVGEDVVRAAMERGIQLGGEEREVAVLFVDLVGSTRLAAERPAPEVVELLNGFFATVVEAVERRHGQINKFQGDAALAVFGAPIARDDAATGALSTARELAGRLRDELPELAAGIGVSAGTAVAGNVGAEHRFEYTVIGDPVNEAARLCELAKEQPGRVLASAAAIERAGGEEAGRWSLGGAVRLRGREADTQVAEPAEAYVPSG